MKKIIKLTESDITRIVKQVLIEEEVSDVIDVSECFDENGVKIPCEGEKTQNLKTVKVVAIKLKQNVANPFGITAIKYFPDNGEIKNAMTNEVISVIEKNLSVIELAKWLRKNRLIKRRQLRDIKRNY